MASTETVNLVTCDPLKACDDAIAYWNKTAETFQERSERCQRESDEAGAESRKAFIKASEWRNAKRAIESAMERELGEDI